MKSKSVRARNYVFRILFGALLFAGVQSAVYGQTYEIPPVNKHPKVIKLPNLGIVDLFEGDTPNSVYVMVGNASGVNAGMFVVRLSFQKKGERKKTYVEKYVSGLKAKTDLPLFINIGQPIEGLEIGVFVDARKQVVETDERNCGKLFPDGGAAGYLSCEGF
jgi:hypothetical protein